MPAHVAQMLEWLHAEMDAIWNHRPCCPWPRKERRQSADCREGWAVWAKLAGEIV